MTVKEYIKIALKNKHYNDLDWFYVFFNRPVTDKGHNDCEMLKVVNGKYVVFLDDNEYILDDAKLSEPILRTEMRVKVGPDDLVNLDKEIETNLGRVIHNKLLLCDTIGKAIPFKKIKRDELQKEVARLLRDTPEEGEKRDPYLIYADDFKGPFHRAASRIEDMANIFAVSVTERLITAPANNIKLRNELEKKAIEKHGEEALSDPAIIAEISNALKANFMEQLKDDESLGTLATGKLIKVALPEMLLSQGYNTGFGDPGDAVYISESLEEGLSRNAKDILANANTTRNGAYSKGIETRESGLMPKHAQRVFAIMKIEKGDCGDKLGRIEIVTESIRNALVGRSIVEKGKVIKFTDTEMVDKYMGKVIQLRSPMMCKKEENKRCSVCCGDAISSTESGAVRSTIEFTGLIFYITMLSRHGAALETEPYDISDKSLGLLC